MVRTELSRRTTVGLKLEEVLASVWTEVAYYFEWLTMIQILYSSVTMLKQHEFKILIHFEEFTYAHLVSVISSLS